MRPEVAFHHVDAMKLRLDGVRKAFAGKTVLDGISADFGDARAVVFIGPSGGGKSTLLRSLDSKRQMRAV